MGGRPRPPPWRNDFHENVVVRVDGREIGHIWVAVRLPDITPTGPAQLAYGHLQDFVAEDEVMWGQARPPCLGHKHALAVHADGMELV